MLLFYNIYDINDIKYYDRYIEFNYNDNTYMFIKSNNIDFYLLYISQSFPYFHKIVKNNNGDVVSVFCSEYYVLLKIEKLYYNRRIMFNDIVQISNLELNLNIKKIDYYNLWKNKIDFLDKYFALNRHDKDFDYEYFLGLAEISLFICKKVNYDNLTYGFSFNRFYNINTLYDLYNPFNTKYGPVANSISEYIKHSFFYLNLKVNIVDIIELYLSDDDFVFLIARLIFPTYFFDLLNNKENNYPLIINRLDNYIQYLKDILRAIKKRYNVPFIDYLINQL